MLPQTTKYFRSNIKLVYLDVTIKGKNKHIFLQQSKLKTKQKTDLQYSIIISLPCLKIKF